jgi:phage terminase large subunit-like protein
MNELPTWTTANPDWEKSIVEGGSLIPFAPLFPDEAAAGLQVMRMLKIVDAPGSPTIGESCAPWVLDFAAAVFGSYDPDSGRRLIREFFLMVPKKASKSTIAAAIMMTLLLRNWRQSAELIVIAPTVEVAQNAFAPARDMVKHDEELSELLHVQEHVRTITHRTTGATLKIVAADSNTVAGKKASFVLVDEVHQFGSMATAEGMLREATGGLAARPEGAILYLTTQSDQPPAGVFKSKLDYARGVRDGVVKDDRFLPVIYEFPAHMIQAGEHKNPANFHLVNPNMGYSVDREFLEREFQKAEVEGESSMRGFLAKFLNVEIGMNLRSDRWAGANFWEPQAKAPGLTLDQLLDRSEVVDVGIDGGGLDDLLGLAVVGRDKDTREWLTWTHAWAHPSVLERRKDVASRLHDFAKDGDLTLVQHIGEDVADVASICALIEARGLLDKIGCDPAGLGGITDALAEAGIPETKMVGIQQGWRLTGAIKTAERKLAEGVMVHGGQPLMAWCVGNAKVEPRGNAVIITKQAAGSAKIDPLMSLFNAVTLMSLNPETAVAPEIHSLDIYS